MLKSYIYYKGFLDGTKGLVFSLYTGLITLNWWIFAWEYQNKITRKELENKFLKNKI